MKVLLTLVFAIGLLSLFSSCQSTSAQMKELSNQETRKKIMNAIANDTMMSQQMIGAMMNNKNGMMMMQSHQTMTIGNHSLMMNMLKDNPGMMHNMMSAMMETANGDTSMISGMIRTMMGNQQMMGMMHTMTNTKVANGMNMGGMNNNHMH